LPNASTLVRDRDRLKVDDRVAAKPAAASAREVTVAL
jgi:hypothetical protein